MTSDSNHSQESGEYNKEHLLFDLLFASNNYDHLKLVYKIEVVNVKATELFLHM